MPLCPAFSFNFAPIPPTPFPAGRGRFLVDFAGGFAPGTPAAEPIGLRKTDKKRSLRVIPPPAEVPVRQGQPVLRPVQPWGCKGRSSLHKIPYSFPLPHRGRGSGGWGATKQAKGRVGRQPQPPRPPPGTETARLAGNAGASPPPARDTPPLLRCRLGSASGYLYGRDSQCRAPSSLGDARGEAPCIK